MFKKLKKDKWFSPAIIGRINAADGRILASAGELVALCHERAAADAATVVAAYAVTVREATPPAAPAAGGPVADLETCRQHLAAMQEIIDAL